MNEPPPPKPPSLATPDPFGPPEPPQGDENEKPKRHAPGQKQLLAMWQEYGGGFYGLGAVLTFMFLELADIFADVREQGGIAGYIGWIISEPESFLVDLFMDGVMNSIWASMWFVYWIMEQGNVAYLYIALAYGLYLAGVALVKYLRKNAFL